MAAWPNRENKQRKISASSNNGHSICGSVANNSSINVGVSAYRGVVMAKINGGINLAYGG